MNVTRRLMVGVLLMHLPLLVGAMLFFEPGFINPKARFWIFLASVIPFLIGRDWVATELKKTNGRADKKE